MKPFKLSTLLQKDVIKYAEHNNISYYQAKTKFSKKKMRIAMLIEEKMNRKLPITFKK